MNDSIMSKKLILSISLTSLALSGCGTTVDCLGYNPESANLQSKNKNLINISIDGSGSMKGFAAANHSAFHRVLEELDDLLGITPALNLTESKTEIWRIGRESLPSTKISKEPLNSLLNARQPNVYDPLANDPWPKVSSTLDQFVSKDKDSIDILVTDLEPDASSIKQILTAIKPKLEYNPNPKSWFSKRDRYVGNQLVLVGVRSQFKGGVFPAVANAFPSFPFQGLRPFYLLILGPTNKVELIVDRLSRLNIQSDHIQISRFAANPAYGLTQFVDISRTEVNPKNCYLQTFSIGAGLSGKLKFDAPNKWLTLQQTRGCQAQQAQIKFGLPKTFGFGSLSTDDKDLIKVENASVLNSNLSSEQSTIVLGLATPPSSINLVDASIQTEKLDQKRWADWNTSPTKPEGGKTQQLLRFINSLRDETNKFARSNGGGRTYSPVRLCSAIKGN